MEDEPFIFRDFAFLIISQEIYCLYDFLGFRLFGAGGYCLKKC
jgi:hypothetical protein